MYKCPKCGCEEYEQDQMRATGGIFAKLFEIQNKKFATISCKKCGFTEIYKKKGKAISNVADFFIG